MRAPLYLLFFVVGALSASKAEEPVDNRFRGVDGIAFPVEKPDEVMILRRISAWGPSALQAELGLAAETRETFGWQRMKWCGLVRLKDADYELCVFEKEGRIDPGENHRVLVLMDSGGKVRAWEKFESPGFLEYGRVVNHPDDPRTYFVAVSGVTRSLGDRLICEKFTLSPDGLALIERGQMEFKAVDAK